MEAASSDTEILLDRAQQGDASAVQRLLMRYRSDLQRMISVRMDSRLMGRIDPSDVVQEAAIEAARKLPEYLQRRDCAFYPWLRQIAWEKLIHAHRQHVRTQRRSVRREVSPQMQLSDDSMMQIVALLSGNQSTPSQQAMRREQRDRMRVALAQIGAGDREILVLRHVEQLKLNDIAGVLGLSVVAAQSRYRRALERLHNQLNVDGSI